MKNKRVQLRSDEIVYIIRRRKEGTPYQEIATYLDRTINCVKKWCERNNLGREFDQRNTTGDTRDRVMKFSRFSEDEKVKIKKLHGEGVGVREIARILCRKSHVGVLNFLKTSNEK